MVMYFYIRETNYKFIILGSSGSAIVGNRKDQLGDMTIVEWRGVSILCMFLYDYAEHC